MVAAEEMIEQNKRRQKLTRHSKVNDKTTPRSDRRQRKLTDKAGVTGCIPRRGDVSIVYLYILKKETKGKSIIFEIINMRA